MWPWTRGEATTRSGRVERPQGLEEQSCPGMARALDRVLSRGRSPEILDLGQVCGSSAVYLAGRGAKVSVEDFEPPRAAGPDAAGVPIRIQQPDGKFDLVLAWEHLDFVPPDRLSEFTAEIGRILAPDGWLLLFSRDGNGAPIEHDRPASYRITADDRMVRTPTTGAARPRWMRPNRAIEHALAPLTVEGIHLRRNGIREFLARKSIA
jgi:hypothetical protein